MKKAPAVKDAPKAPKTRQFNPIGVASAAGVTTILKRDGKIISVREVKNGK